MKFNVKERIVLSGILPAVGSFINLKLIRVVKEDLSFSEKENKLLEFSQVGQQLNWKEGAIEDKDVNFGTVIKDLIINELKQLDKNEALKEEHMSLYEKFIGE